MAWQDPNGMGANAGDASNETAARVSTDWACDGSAHRDGYYYTDTYSTVATGQKQNADASHHALFNGQKHPSAEDDSKMSTNRRISPAAPASPFYLSVDSPIDQGPSIDAVASARLRGLQVSHIAHLMQQDPCRLADALGLANVEANTIRRWQAECRLVCRVPNLRGFDARILVACGITTPATLASTHPIDLLHQVESFLATERGQQILLSGTSHELARITGWIATANSRALNKQSRATNREGQGGTQQDRPTGKNALRQKRTATNHDLEFNPNLTRRRRSEPVRREQRKKVNTAETDRQQVVQYKNNSTTAQHDLDQGQPHSESEVHELRFYLQRDAPVVDAPSIGERMEERLQAIGIYTVEDLLNADTEEVASELDHRRVDADTVLQWQQQTTLVCCVPMLRGHDAQLLVAAEVLTPEDLANCDAEDLFGIIEPIALSNEGKRILRGGKLPDLDEVTDWINFAQHTRELRAA
jgi:predicted flap endonuclease-1-like 5' DNA nuclease